MHRSGGRVLIHEVYISFLVDSIIRLSEIEHLFTRYDTYEHKFRQNQEIIEIELQIPISGLTHGG